MHKLSDLLFVSSNIHKFKEAKEILDSFGISIKFFKLTLEEIQSNSIKQIALKKAKDAFSKCNAPLIIEDDGLHIDSLGGFPGPYSSYVQKTIGNKGILKLLNRSRDGKFISTITYCDKNNLKSFEGKLFGTISKLEKGKGWGFDPIFIPKNQKKTYGELIDKNNISHRYKALKKFSNWYLHKPKSNDQ
ncbi:RdgB/HAM1 family non-canonical purine NTP pyrophosphatase [Nitrosopumilus sp. Nsub]|uniref:RdgB/HAM1 family non-canonical purine NTP pyrophosphatase n=1 Tax=Nitrosopumilus sp. Nsub TaxID=1776294 RepID=UPI0008344341|nr:RdgB/HAM1 family non-canonical purine NTP pyrophosphatase [Nitrosopumilus sp. Nsub]